MGFCLTGLVAAVLAAIGTIVSGGEMWRAVLAYLAIGTVVSGALVLKQLYESYEALRREETTPV